MASGIDLTAQARAGKLDPVIGRANEIERVIQILSRRLKNNPALIGEPGVGKTAIVDGLAQRIAAGDVPETLLGKRSTDAGYWLARRRDESIAASLRSASRKSLRKLRGQAIVSCSSMSCTPSLVLVPPRALLMQPISSSQPSRAVSCSASAPPPLMSIANILNAMPLWNAVSSPFRYRIDDRGDYSYLARPTPAL